jgi:hypothetical protein
MSVKAVVLFSLAMSLYSPAEAQYPRWYQTTTVEVHSSLLSYWPQASLDRDVGYGVDAWSSMPSDSVWVLNFTYSVPNMDYYIILKVEDPISNVDLTVAETETYLCGPAADTICGATVRISPIYVDSLVGDIAPDPNYYSLVTVIAHEIGHAMGLSHSMNPAAIMYKSVSKGEVKYVAGLADRNLWTSRYCVPPTGSCVIFLP